VSGARRRLGSVLPLAALAALGVATGASRASDAGPAPLVAQLAREYLDHRASYEFSEDPAALAATERLLDRTKAIPPWMLSGDALADREILRARLERIVARGLEQASGRASRLRSGPVPAPGSAAETTWAGSIERLAASVGDLLPDEIAAATSDLALERARAGSRARAALDRLAAALDARTRELERRPVSRPERDHLRTLRAAAGFTGSLEELTMLAELEDRSLGEAMEVVALDAGAPSAVSLIERLKEEGAREDPVSVAREEAARAAAFVRERGLISVPQGVPESLEVEEGDPRARTPFGHYIPLGWRGPVGHYVVTSPSGDDPGALSRRRESHRLWLRGVAAHEGVPGHHLHFAVAARSQDELRRLPFDGATTEGWGLFVEGVLARAGYFADPIEARLTPLRLRRWRAVRVLLDLGLHTGRLSREDAIGRLQRALGFDRTVAEDEVDRYKERPGYYSGYLLGALAYERVERDALARGGPEAARRVRDRILALGPSAPLEAIERLAADERVPGVTR
jgi:hypothetical protein